MAGEATLSFKAEAFKSGEKFLLTVLNVENLPDDKGLFNKSDAYFRIKVVGNPTRTTKTVPDTSSPVWETGNTFVFSGGAGTVVHLICMDWDPEGDDEELISGTIVLTNDILDGEVAMTQLQVEDASSSSTSADEEEGKELRGDMSSQLRRRKGRKNRGRGNQKGRLGHHYQRNETHAMQIVKQQDKGTSAKFMLHMDSSEVPRIEVRIDLTGANGKAGPGAGNGTHTKSFYPNEQVPTPHLQVSNFVLIRNGKPLHQAGNADSATVMSEDDLRRIWPRANYPLARGDRVPLEPKQRRARSKLQKIVDWVGQNKNKNLGNITVMTFEGWGNNKN